MCSTRDVVRFEFWLAPIPRWHADLEAAIERQEAVGCNWMVEGAREPVSSAAISVETSDILEPIVATSRFEKPSRTSTPATSDSLVG